MAKTANGAFYGTGRRKSSIARVYVTPGTGVVTVNKRPLDEYFGDETLRTVALEPFVATQTEGKYDVKVNVHGGRSWKVEVNDCPSENNEVNDTKY